MCHYIGACAGNQCARFYLYALKTAELIDDFGGVVNGAAFGVEIDGGGFDALAKCLIYLIAEVVGSPSEVDAPCDAEL